MKRAYVILVVLAPGLVGAGYLLHRRPLTVTERAAPVGASPAAAPRKMDLPTLVDQVSPSVVKIITQDKDGQPLMQGSGFFVAPGELVTNFHVIEGAYSLDVSLRNGETFSFDTILAEDPTHDLAIITMERANRPRRASLEYAKQYRESKPLSDEVSRSERYERVILLGKAISARELELAEAVPVVSAARSPVRVGETVIVVGCPLGLDQTVSQGIVSGLPDIGKRDHMIQLTAPISQGSSGSPVFNEVGDVVGVATFQLINGQALNFAVPIEHVMNLKRQPARRLTERAARDRREGDVDEYTRMLEEAAFPDEKHP